MQFCLLPSPEIQRVATTPMVCLTVHILQIVAQGTVSSPETLENGHAEFLLTVQDYVCGGMKTSTIVFVTSLSHPFSHSTDYHCPTAAAWTN